MKRELKIVIEYEAEGIDCDQGTPFNTSKVKVYNDDVAIGYIQKIAFVAAVDGYVPELEITLPDTSEWPRTWEGAKHIEANARIFYKIPGVAVRRS